MAPQRAESAKCARVRAGRECPKVLSVLSDNCDEDDDDEGDSDGGDGDGGDSGAGNF
jgi:hypothetical protein